MRRVCVALATVLAFLANGSIHAQRPQPVDDFRVVPDNPTDILGQLNEFSAQRENAYLRGSPYNRYGPPDALDRYVASLWRQHGVPDAWEGHCPYCYRSLLDAAASSSFAVLRIQAAEWDYRFLVFVAPEGPATSWRFARYADTEAKYDVPEYRIEHLAGSSFLVVEHDTGGTGLYERGDTWSELAPRADGAALDLPTKGHDEFLQVPSTRAYVVEHDWESTIAHRPDARDNSLHVALAVKYSMYGPSGTVGELFERHQTAAFVRDGAGRRFRFDPSRSDVSEQELHDVYRAEGMTAATFAKYNAADVARILNRGTEAQKRALTVLGVAGK